MGLIFNGNGDVIKAVDGSLTVEGLDLGGGSNIVAGVGTFSDLNVTGVLTYEDVKNVDSVGIISARQSIHVGYGVSAAGIITATSYRGDGSQLTGISQVGGATTVGFDDNKPIYFGSEDDYKMYWNGTRMYFEPTSSSTTQVLEIVSNDQMYITSKDNGLFLRSGNQNVIDIYGGGGGGVYFKHNNTQKLKLEGGNWTYLNGATVTHVGDTTWDSSAGADYDMQWTTANGQLRIKDSGKLVFGSSGDVSVYHDDSNFTLWNTKGNSYIQNTGDVYIRTNNTQTKIQAKAGGAVDLYHNTTKRLETTSSGVTVTGDLISTSHLKNNTAGYGLHNTATNAYFYSQGSNETRLYHSANAQIKLSFRGSGNVLRGAVSADASGMHILTAGSSEQKGIRCITDGATELYHSGTLKCETQSFGLEVHGGKVEIKGTEGGEAQLLLAADEGDDNDDVWRMIAMTNNLMELGNTHGGTWETNAKFEGGGSCYFYENNIRKMRTVSDGIQVEGGEGQKAIVTLMADEGDDAASDYWRMVADTDATYRIEQYDGSGWATHVQVSNSWMNLVSVEGNQGSATLKLKKNSAASNVQSTMITFEVGNQGRGKIVSSHSDASSPQFSSWSDRRLKTNFRNYTGGYDKIKAIPVKLYDEVRTGQTDRVGWIADEFQTVFPEAVEGTKDAVDSDGNPEYQSLAQGTIFPDVVQALQAAIAKIEVLEAEVAALKSS